MHPGKKDDIFRSAAEAARSRPRKPRGVGALLISKVRNRTFADERAYAEVKRLSAAGLDGPELLRRVAERLRRVVPFGAYCASTVDPASNLITHGVADGFGADDAEAGNVFLDRVYFEEDLGQLAAMVRERRPVQLLSESTAGDLDRSLRYRELLRPQGFGYELGGAFVYGGLWGGMDLIREAGDPDFTAADAALVRRVAPHVGAGLKAAALRSRATAQAAGPGSGLDAPGIDAPSVDAPGVLVLDGAGRVASHTPSAERWLQDLEDLRPGWREGDLPVAVRMVAGALRRSLSPTSEKDRNLLPKVRARGRSGRWLSLYASLTEPTFGRTGETVVVVEPAKAEEVAWLNVAAHGLTRREEEVVRLVVGGLSNRQISTSLFISEYTVQRHLQNVFEKVGVRSRNALLKRLFFENLLPGLGG
jgi:DNA-binding CsgD family transcriptional regulator